MGPPPRKRVKTERVEQVTFDDAARAEYLTGFHKRKVARTKMAQEAAAKREKEERVVQRRELRQQRKADLERHVAEVNALLRKADPDASSNSDDDEDDDNETEGWNGIQEEVVDHEEEYVDEDKYTTVTVETVDIDRDGFKRRRAAGENGSDGESQDGVKGAKEGDDSDVEDEGGAKKPNGKRAWTKEKPKGERLKKKKQKFRYESKAERKVTREKQRSKNKAHASARREK